MDITLEQVLKGKATKIRDKEFYPTEAYVEPFLERISKFKGVEFKCHAELPKQITITKAEDINSVEDITYNRVWIEAVLPNEFVINNHDRVIGMVYGIDTRVPICKFYRGGENRACTNLCVFDPSDLSVQPMEPTKAINYSSLDFIMDRTSTIKTFLENLENTPFNCDSTNIEQSLGMWIDNSIELCYNNGISKASISASTIISAYKLLFKNTKSPYYVDVNHGINATTMFNVYNAFTEILTHKDKDIMNKADKCLLIKDILNIE